MTWHTVDDYLVQTIIRDYFRRDLTFSQPLTQISHLKTVIWFGSRRTNVFYNKSMFLEPWAAPDEKRVFMSWDYNSNEDLFARVSKRGAKRTDIHTVSTLHLQNSSLTGERSEISAGKAIRHLLCNFARVVCDWYWWTGEGWHAPRALVLTPQNILSRL